MAVKEINKPHSKIGVSNYTFFPITADDIATGKTTYGEAVTLPGTVEIAPTDSGSTSTFDADNGAYEVDSYVEKMGHEITNADIPPEVDAMWRGAELVDNGVEFNKDTAAKAEYFAVAWIIEKANGVKRLVRYYKGKYVLPQISEARQKLLRARPNIRQPKPHFQPYSVILTVKDITI